MPHLNPDDAANDEPKTYNDEAIGGDDSNDLNDIKGDLVDEDDGDPMQRTFENKNPSNRVEDRKLCLEREQSHEIGNGRTNFPYSAEEMDSLVSGLSRPLFQNGFLPPSSQVPYSHYMPPYMGSFFRGGPLDLEAKTGIPRLPYTDMPAMYPLPGQLGQIPNPLSPWPPSPLNSLCTASAMAGMLRYPYPFHGFSSSGGVRNVSPFPLVPPHRNGIHPNMLHPGTFSLPHHIKGHSNMGKPPTDKKLLDSTKRDKCMDKPKQPYVKKPLNAFMIYMKEHRAAVVAECTLKESAAINQILGIRWRNLAKEEQQKYYDIARKERQLHMQKHPSWSARDNYGKKKKRKKEKSQDCTGPSAKKCRAVFGLEQQQSWCAPCRRKKKCIRYHHDGDDSDSDDSCISPGQDSPIASSQLTPTSLHQSSISSNNGSQSGSETVHDTSSSNQSRLVDVKVEKSPPQFTEPQQLSTDASAQKQPHSHPPGGSDSSSTRTGSLHKRVDSGSIPARHGFEEGLRSLTNSFSHPANDIRINRSSSTSDTSLNSNSSGSQRLYNSPLLSPSNLNSPHPNSPLLSNISYFAAAAGLPPSPLGGLMGFPGFNGLTSPLHMGLNPSGTPVGSASHVQSSGSRLSTSALEGRS